MIKKIISIAGSILIGYIAMRLLGLIFSVAFAMMFFMFKIGIIAVIAVPFYFLISKWIKK